jgi:predicted nucleic acid-binding protein
MIVLDTNVLSELMRPEPDRAVVEWVDAQEPAELLLTAVTVAEILYGIRRLPEDKRKSSLLEVAVLVLSNDFAERILAFDEAAAVHYAALVIERERCGRPIGMADAQIAAICRSVQGASLATRNLKDFSDLGLDLVNPWTGEAHRPAPQP